MHLNDVVALKMEVHFGNYKPTFLLFCCLNENWNVVIPICACFGYIKHNINVIKKNTGNIMRHIKDNNM
jgi:hypothetical protein